MKIKKMVLNILLSIVNSITCCFTIKENQITFVSLESNVLENDLKLIYDALASTNKYTLRCVLIKFDKNTLWTNFKYMLNTIKQVYYINRSKLVIINDNNYVISTYKRTGVKVLQVWHATGAIKKFGNVIKREYPIQNYDYVIANSEYWCQPYSQAFGVVPSQVKVTGMPRVDHLLDVQYLSKTKERLLRKYPALQGKKIILYAPTFRGNIYQGFYNVPFDGVKLIEALGDEFAIVYKYHPLMKESEIANHPSLFLMNNEDTHDLFTISECLISDFSSIIFDYALLNKPMFFYVPDLDGYLEKLGCFVEYEKMMPGPICFDEESLIEMLQQADSSNVQEFKDTFFAHQDGKNLDRTIVLIDEIMKKTAY